MQMAMDSEIILKEMNQTGVPMNTELQPSIGLVARIQTKTDIQIWMVHGRTQDGNYMELGPIISEQTQHSGDVSVGRGQPGWAGDRGVAEQGGAGQPEEHQQDLHQREGELHQQADQGVQTVAGGLQTLHTVV